MSDCPKIRIITIAFVISPITVTKMYMYLIDVLIISSPELKAHGELIVYQSSRRACVHPHFQTLISLRPVDRLPQDFI